MNAMVTPVYGTTPTHLAVNAMVTTGSGTTPTHKAMMLRLPHTRRCYGYNTQGTATVITVSGTHIWWATQRYTPTLKLFSSSMESDRNELYFLWHETV